MKIKKLLNRTVCVLLALAVALCSVGCGEEKATKKKKKKIEEIIVINDKNSDNNSSLDDNDDTNSSSQNGESQSDKIKRELYKAEEDVRYTESFEPEFSYKKVKWNGPDGYVIIYSDLCRYSKSVSVKLQSFFKESYGVTLKVEKDTESKAHSKEILVGDTNRYISKLAENKFGVSFSENKLIFEGGHFAMVEKAADWFMTVKCDKNEVAVLSGISSDFKSSLDGGYKYVWGDEFDGMGIDYSKWDASDIGINMNGTQKLYMTKGSEAEKTGSAAVENGRLKLRGKRYFNQLAKEYEYVTAEMSTKSTLNYLHGYAELRARLPMQKGAWPSWWTTTAYRPELFRKGYTYEETPYRLEVDIFEVFASETVIVPNFHKWWSALNGYTAPAGYHSEYPQNKKEIYSFKANTNLKNEYHTYGFKWTPEKMVISVDGKEYQTYDLKNGFDGQNEYNEFIEQPLYFIIDNYIITSDVTSINTGGKIIDPAVLPIEYDIDYIRLYQTDGSGLWTAIED